MIIEYRMRTAFLRNLLTQALHGMVSAVSTKTNAGFVHSLCNPPIISTRSAHSCIWVICEFWQLITNIRIVFASNKRIPPALQAFLSGVCAFKWQWIRAPFAAGELKDDIWAAKDLFWENPEKFGQKLARFSKMLTNFANFVLKTRGHVHGERG